MLERVNESLELIWGELRNAEVRESALVKRGEEFLEVEFFLIFGEATSAFFDGAELFADIASRGVREAGD